MSSTDYWLAHTSCPACEHGDHEHCDPDREDCPSLLCECRVEIIPAPREAGE